MTKSIGWGVLAEVTGREIVMGAVTQPWRANVVFRPLPPGEFSAFKEPDYVKVVWTLRADPAGTSRSIFRTEPVPSQQTRLLERSFGVTGPSCRPASS